MEDIVEKVKAFTDEELELQLLVAKTLHRIAPPPPPDPAGFLKMAYGLKFLRPGAMVLVGDVAS